jgi:predicted ATP-binding protein involved in virulence
MRIEQILLHNFKLFNDKEIEFSPHFNVLIGDNATGKTTILDALAILLGSYFLNSGITTGCPSFNDLYARHIYHKFDDVTTIENESPVFIKPKGLYFDNRDNRYHDISWQRNLKDKGRLASGIKELGEYHRNSIRKSSVVTLPLMLYYGTGRIWSVIGRERIDKAGSRLDGYKFCLDPRSNQKMFSEWFMRLYGSSLQKDKDISALTAVNNAVITCIEKAEEFYYDFDLGQLMFKHKQHGVNPLNILSDGYRNMVSMVADIAHRSARLNPHLGKDSSLETEGVVLIDEIDLHLHPKWQRSVVDNLKKAFPKIQFITTTHSPFIVQSLKADEVIDLNPPGEEPLSDDYQNSSIEDIAEFQMGVILPSRSRRYWEMYETAKKYYKLLENAKTASSLEKEELERQLDILLIPFGRKEDASFIAFLEMERIAAGLNIEKKG